MGEPELETMRPNPVWDATAYEDAVDTFARLRDGLAVKVWCGDWCPDCRSQLPDFAAALAAADVPADRIHQYPVRTADDGSKVGPGVEEYDVEYIPTVVVELATPGDTDDASGARVEPHAATGEEVARFVEDADVPIVVDLARQLEALE